MIKNLLSRQYIMMLQTLAVLMLAGIILSNPVHAMKISHVMIADNLNNDLSMHEQIILAIENNTLGEFTLELPIGGYDITINNLLINDTNRTKISSEIQCENCTVTISYSFSKIIQTYIQNTTNETTYIFRRVINMPVNVSAMNYTIILPKGNELFNINELSSSLIPAPQSIIGNDTFVWSYDNPEFPKEFAVRYKEENRKIASSQFEIDDTINYYVLIIILLALFVILIFIIRKIIRKKKNKIMR